ncbi:hypothetical protein SAMN05421543_11593 [Alicyclobacillus macrosporangiidus]|uniref:Uncharacterized protein n=1 Tax=Alicyclobacillus macrosporangiidus TaxID=392015 RepID=A0A1I7KF59_9BACL|nr:hypothetical protein SAMN05421543_11593 [Alicyclobacillus macrosporangiidus]
MERSEAEELRILRRVVAHKQAKLHKRPVVRVESRMNGPIVEHRATLVLYEVPPPMGVQANELAELANVALRRAQDHCSRLGYSKVLGVRFNGKAWEAKFQI